MLPSVYWKEWSAKALAETTKLFSGLAAKVLPPLFAPAFLYLEFGMGGLVNLSAIWKVALALAESYSLAFVAIYAWKLFAVVPMLLGERDQTIADRNKQIADLTKANISDFKATITRLQMLSTNIDVRDQQRMNISTTLQVHYRGDRVHMNARNFQLWMGGLDLGSSIFEGPREFKSGFLHISAEFAFRPINFDDAARAQLRTTKWKFTFVDNFDEIHESEIFQLDKT